MQRLNVVARLRLLGALLLAAAGPAACVASSAASSSSAGSAPSPSGAASAVDLRQVEREILLELNAARTAPAQYAGRIEALLRHFDGRILRRPGEVAVATGEGAAAVREAAAALRETAPRGGVVLVAGMERAARDHANDQGSRGTTGHRGSDGSDAATRVNRYGRWSGRLTESIAYGPVTGADVVRGLLIDDGVSDRGHRRNLLDRSVSVAGVGCAFHTRYRVTCVIELAGGYEAR